MKGKELRSILPQLKLGDGLAEEAFDSQEFKNLRDRHNLDNESIYFCGAKKFWESFLDKKCEKVFVLFSQSFLNQIEDDVKKELGDQNFYGSVENLPLAMSFLSKPFYEEKCSTENDEVDGRQMGTCDVHPTASLAQNVFLGANVSIGANVRIYPGCVISSNCKIGEGTVLYPNVTLMPNSTLGSHCRIHSGTVIGSDGFGYNFDQGVHHKLYHMGGVVIGNHVELGSNVSVDQGSFSPTLIGDGAKIDNLVQVAHNCRVGAGVILCGQAGLAGSVEMGDFSVVGGNASIAPDVQVGMAAQVGGMAGVTGNVSPKEAVAGFPARPVKEWLRGAAALRKLALKK